MKKKIISVFLTVSMIVSIFSFYPTFAGSSAILSLNVSDDTLTAGSEFTVTVGLSGCEKCKSAGIAFAYDLEKTFEIVDGEWLLTGTALSNFTTNMVPTGTAAAAYSGETDINGDIFTLTLKVKDDAAVGNYEIKATPTIKNGTKTIECTSGAVIVSVSEEECTHKNKTYYGETESTCKEQGNDAYYVCEDCGKILSSDGITEVAERPFRPLGGHTGGKATCKALAVCSVCGNTYGSYAMHSYTEKKEEKYLKEYDSETGIYTYYKSCSVCGEASEETFECSENTFTLSVESKRVVSGNEFTVDVKIENNPGFGYLEITPGYDEGLTLTGVTNGELISDFTHVKQYIWVVSDEDTHENGTLLTLTFTTDKDLTPGDYEINFVVRGCVTCDEDNVSLQVVPGNIEVIDFIYGDANGDEVINGQDIMRLKKYLANYDYDTDTCEIEIGPGADCNGDGVVNGQDVMRLKKYLANYDYDTNTCSVVLGPQ